MLDFLVSYALSFVGQPYRWGGDDTINGFDCSGLIQEILAAVGMDPPGDQTAQGLYAYFLPRQMLTSNALAAGALCFYGASEDRITHVGFSLGNGCMVEAGGGNSRTQTRADAARQNAYVRVRPIQHRHDLVAVIIPCYPDVQ